METSGDLKHKGRALMNGISALTEEAPQSSLTPHTSCQVRTQGEVCDLEEGPHPPMSVGDMILDSQPPDCEKQISVVYNPPSPQYFAIAA